MAEGALVVRTAYGYLNNQTARLTRRAVNVTFVLHLSKLLLCFCFARLSIADFPQKGENSKCIVLLID
jgi:hypothetical protein